MDDHNEGPGGFPGTLRRVGAAVLAVVQNRLELLVVELHEERIRLFEALLLLMAIVALGLLTLALAAAAVIALIWKSFGIGGLFVLSGIALLCAALVCWRLRSRLKNWPLLPGTLDQLRKDRECLEKK